MDDLRVKALKLAGELPKGSEARRKILGALQLPAGSVSKRAALGMSILSVKSGVEFLFDVTSGFTQIGMGGEWWTGTIKKPGRHVFKHRKERSDPAYQPVTINVYSLRTGIRFSVEGGFGDEASFWMAAEGEM
jgi:hypothetical protein